MRNQKIHNFKGMVQDDDKKNYGYEDNGRYYISQEFNGDKKEALQWNASTILKTNWEDVLTLFYGCTTLNRFRNAI